MDWALDPVIRSDDLTHLYWPLAGLALLLVWVLRQGLGRFWRWLVIVLGALPLAFLTFAATDFIEHMPPLPGVDYTHNWQAGLLTMGLWAFVIYLGWALLLALSARRPPAGAVARRKSRDG